MASSSFGRALRTEHFPFAPDYLPLNHGAYGATPKPVQEARNAASASLDARPDEYIRYDLPREMGKSRRAVAELLNCDAEDVVLLQNATSAIDTVLRNLCGVADGNGANGSDAENGERWNWRDGDAVVYYQGAYPAVEKGLLYAAESRWGVRLEEVEVKWPISDDELVRRFEEAIVRVNGEEDRPNGHEVGSVDSGSTPARRHGKVRLAVFDTIISMPGIRIPWERLCEICRRHGVLSLVDGAHGLGQIPIDLGKTRPDFFTTNLHKWLFVPRGCAAFYVSRAAQPLLRSTLPTSLNFVPLPGATPGGAHHPLPPIGNNSPFVDLFSWTATVDYSGYMAVEEALRFRKTVLGGEDAIMRYQIQLAKKAGKIAAGVLGTDVMAAEGSGMNECAFANVRLPLRLEGDELGENRTSFVAVPASLKEHVIAFLQYEGVYKSGLYAQTTCYRGAWWWRISAAPYVDEDDVKRGAEIVRSLCERIGKGELDKFKENMEQD